jgi:S1-C subfamily serine protease
MPTVDLIAAACILGLMAWGAWAGLAVTLPLAGFAAGALLGAMLAPLALHEGHESSFALVFALPGALIAGAFIAALVERRTVRLRRRVARLDRYRTLSTVGGGALGTFAGLVAAWLVGAGILQVSSLRDRVEDSAIIGSLNAVLAPPGPTAGEALKPLDLFPIVSGVGPDIRRPVASVVADPQVRLADRSVLQVAVLGCRGAGTGSGWVAANSIVVTNAHVVAAADVISVKRGTSAGAHPATTIWFDPRNDVALLRVPELAGVPALELVRTPRDGTAGATLGFPLGNHAIRPARIGRTSATIRGLITGRPPEAGFDSGIAGRLTTPFRGLTEHGNSGGPVVDTTGRVLTTVWGARSDRGSGLGVPNRFVAAALRRAGPAVSTGKCRRPPSDRIG